jgi:hypothetical protein
MAMKAVYQNSALTVCASAAANGSEASFTSRDLFLLRPLQITPRWQDIETQFYYIRNDEMYTDEIRRSPLQSRAWTFQEYYLSQRTLSLTRSQLWWRCAQNAACEAFPRRYPGPLPPPLLYLPTAVLTAAEEGKERHLGSSEHRPHDERWYNLVADYSRRQLTVETDKLIAFSGVAQEFKIKIFPGDEYVAGIWSSQLPLGLCWLTPYNEATSRPEHYVAPSWSWASVKGPIEVGCLIDSFNGLTGQHHRFAGGTRLYCSVLNIRMEHTNKLHDTGSVISGHLDLEGHLIGPWKWDFQDQTMHITMNSVSGLVMGLELESALREAVVDFDVHNGGRTSYEGWLAYLDAENEAENESADGGLSPLFLIPVADNNVYGTDDTEYTKGIIVAPTGSADGTFYRRVGLFSMLEMPSGTLENYPLQRVTLE